MKKILVWVGAVLGSLVGLLVVLIVVLVFIGSSRVNQTYDIQVASVSVPTDPAGMARGEHLVQSIGLCMECHGENLGGDVLSDDPVFGHLAPSNLTAGLGGIGGEYTDIDYVRAIRHGIGQDGKSLVVMPSQHFNKIGDEDLGSIIAYLKSLPPIDNELDETSLAPIGKIFTLLEADLLPASVIDHEAPRPPTPPVGVSAAYGEYLAAVCAACHGEHLSGGTVPGDDPGPKAPNLTALPQATWTEADLITALRTGVTLTGKQLDPEFMPWDRFANLTDDELKAIWLFLSSLQPREFEK